MIKRKYINYSVKDPDKAFDLVSGTEKHPIEYEGIDADTIALDEIGMFDRFVDYLSVTLKRPRLEWYAAGSAAAFIYGCDNHIDVPEPRDVDIYFRKVSDLSDFIEMVHRAIDNNLMPKNVSFYKRNLDYIIRVDDDKFKYDIQIAVDPKWHVPARELMEHFDYTICMFSIHSRAIRKTERSYEIMFLKEAAVDLNEKILNIHSTMTPKDSCYRAMKYLESGYAVGPKTPSRLIRSVKNQMKWDNHNGFGV